MLFMPLLSKYLHYFQASTEYAVNGHTAKQKIKLLDKNPFFSDSIPQKAPPVKFSMFSKSKLIKSPNLNTNKTVNSSQSQNRPFIGPMLPVNHNSPSLHKKYNAVNGKPDRFTAGDVQKEEKHTDNSQKKLVNGKSSDIKTKNRDEFSVVPSSLDIIKSSYDNDSDSDEQKLKTHSSNVVFSPKTKHSATGSKTLNIFDQLHQKNSVKTWNGEKSKNFSSNNNGCGSVWGDLSNPKKRIRDSYDKELDEGKRKKFKHKIYNHKNGNKHAFQCKYEQQHQQNRNYKLPWKTKKHI